MQGVKDLNEDMGESVQLTSIGLAFLTGTMNAEEKMS